MYVVRLKTMLKNYLKFAKYINGDVLLKGYRNYMGESFMKYTFEYIEKITELQCTAWWHYDVIEKGKLFSYLNGIIHRLMRPFSKSLGVNLIMLLHEQSYFSSIDEESFCTYTKEYIYKVIECLNKEHADIVMVDQLLPPSNIDSYLHYFDDIKVIVSERDPRDIYIYEKELYHSGIIPTKNVQDYCKWYKITRKHRERELYDKDKVFLINFEDLVYKYKETSAEIIKFIGIKEMNHSSPKSLFDPKVSINNTRLWIKHTKYNDDIKYIEKELSEYLYEFPV